MGVAPKVNPRYLPDQAAQVALDVEARGQSLKPLNGVGSALLTLEKTGALQSIYRWGQDEAVDTQYWLHWTGDVDVCRSQIAGDVAEWTFWTDGVFPKSSYNALIVQGGSTAYPIAWHRLGLKRPTAAVACAPVAPTPAAASASVTLTPTHLAAMTIAYGVRISIDNGTTNAQVTLTVDAPTASQLATRINATPAATALVTVAVNGVNLIVTSKATGTTVKLVVRWGAGTTAAVSASGTTASLGTAETRVYTYTWLANHAGLVKESQPAPPSAQVDVYAGGSVTLTGFGTLPTTNNYLANGMRIYRATAGTYLFVAELVGAALTTALATGWSDTVAADALGEACPSVDYEEPVATLRGLVNLPNGMMAGFTGRDVYFCEPYRPYAWPSAYSQAVDYPVMGLGRIDTTLVVLTKGTPFFAQGSSPADIVLVKADIEQACVAKRSVVSMGGAVLYASPDGLVSLSPGGSRILTEAIIDRDTWQSLNPSSIHAYSHDRQYVAFYTKTDGTQGGFVYDLATNNLVFHTFGLGAEVDIKGGYADLRNDTLYLVNASRQIVKWHGGAVRSGTWRSKIFSLPQITGFSCAQVEAESFTDAAGTTWPAYPTGPSMQCKVYCDGTLIHTQTLTARGPWRLPPIQGRDWEMELLNIRSEVFKVAIAQAPSEIAEV